MIYKPGDLPECCTETLFQTTSNWLYVELAEAQEVFVCMCFAGLFCV